MAIGISNGAPGTPVEIPAPGGQFTAITSIWCADVGDCAIVGDTETAANYFEPLTAYEASGSWSDPAPPPGSAPVAGVSFDALVGIGCTAVADCMSAGVQFTASGINAMADFSAAPASVTTTSLPAATAGAPYSATLQGAGGAGSSSWSVTAGSLPAGLSLNASTGVISGTPSVPGSSSFTVQLTSNGPPSQTASANLSITVASVPSLSVGAAKVTPSGVTLHIGCSGSGTCTGTAVITAVEHLTGKRPTAVTARAKKRKVTITLARASYSLGAGQLGSVNLKLTAQARALLKRLHKISGRLTVTPTGATAPVLTKTVTFKSATKKKK